MSAASNKHRIFSKEEIEQASQVDIRVVAEQLGLVIEKGGRKADHVQGFAGLYLFKNSNRYYQHSTNERGGTIDLVMKIRQVPFATAVAELLGEDLQRHIFKESTYRQRATEREDVPVPLLLPERADNIKRMYRYLVGERKVDASIVSATVKNKTCYQDSAGNCVFVGYDVHTGEPKYCSRRGTSGVTFKQDVTGSDKSYPFVLAGKSNVVIVCESPIDVMSHASLAKLHGGDWQHDYRISLGCTHDRALERFLADHENIDHIVIALDNDYCSVNFHGEPTNWGQLAAKHLAQKYDGLGYNVVIQTPELKDWNSQLQAIKNGRDEASLSFLREIEIFETFGAFHAEEREKDNTQLVKEL